MRTVCGPMANWPLAPWQASPALDADSRVHEPSLCGFMYAPTVVEFCTAPSTERTIVSADLSDDGSLIALVTWTLEEQLNDDGVTVIPADLEPVLRQTTATRTATATPTTPRTLGVMLISATVADQSGGGGATGADADGGWTGNTAVSVASGWVTGDTIGGAI